MQSDEEVVSNSRFFQLSFTYPTLVTCFTAIQHTVLFCNHNFTLLKVCKKEKFSSTCKYGGCNLRSVTLVEGKS
jgi:hypothetical protein